MDLITTEKKIIEVEKAIQRDLAEAEKTDGLVRRYQEKKKILESKVRENRALLSNLKNRRTVLTIESRIGTMDESKLALLDEFLGAHGDAFDSASPDNKEDTDEGEKNHSSPVGE
ncbi:MAG: hypothetical protein IJH60_06085 [Eubacterium sp.]|nr:hypothetical protein [Eubacterium sp.]